MKLSQLLKKINHKHFISGSTDMDITCVCADSKTVKTGSLFVAIDGTKVKGSSFIEEAIGKGAVCVVVPEDTFGNVSRKVPVISSPDTRYCLAMLADEFFGHPSGRLKVVGITGTNGKTTITYLIRSILQEVNFSSGIIGTINYSFKDKIIPAPNTTPGPLALQSLLKQMADAGCHYCVMEVSSHALDQKRAEGIDVEAAIFTNLTQDHLDYHGNLENYFLAKARLFSGLPEDSYAILNAECPFGRRLIPLTKGKVITYAIGLPADIMASEVKLSLEGSECIVHTPEANVKLKTKLIGSHNISNVLASVAFGLSQGIALEDITKAIASFSGVKGRLEKVACNDRNIFIDYAHTPDALENVLRALRQLSGNKLTVVFGCGGERDSLKRPLMGNVAARYADTIIITNDNPRSESPEKITGDITSGIKGREYKVILDRKEAIAYAIAQSQAQDTVLIAGKGHENYQIFKDKKVAFDDIIAARKCLQGIPSE